MKNEKRISCLAQITAIGYKQVVRLTEKGSCTNEWREGGGLKDYNNNHVKGKAGLGRSRTQCQGLLLSRIQQTGQ